VQHGAGDVRGVSAREVEPGRQQDRLAIQSRQGEQRAPQRPVLDLLRRIGSVHPGLQVEQCVERARASPAAPRVRQDAARHADQPAQFGVARDVALTSPGDRVRLGDGVVGVLARRHRACVGEHPGVGLAVEAFEVHAG
jgi:hypothetical protein